MLRMLLRSDVADKIGRLYRSGTVPTAAQRQEFMTARAARPKLAATLAGARPAAANDPENYAVVGSVAQICVEGVLSEEPDFWAWLFGMDGTTYEDIRDALALAASDPLVKSVVFAVSSPGGYVDGLFETLAAIESFKKPMTVQSSQACSAAYAISAMAGPITAIGPASCFGSIGVACSFAFDADTEIVDVTSTEAPDKRPDPRTPEGKAVIVTELDAIHELFVDAIARGRSSATGKQYTVEQVNADFGRGATMLAAAAKSAGLIDKMPRATTRGSSAIDGGATEEPKPTAPVAADQAPVTQLPPRSTGQAKAKTMNEAELLAAHPELHAALILRGVTAERKRVTEHLDLGSTSAAADKVAREAIASGATVIECHGSYLKTLLAARDITARQAESDDAGQVLNGAAPVVADGGKDLGDLVADRVCGPEKKAS